MTAPAAPASTTYDAVVVGGGIVGLATAWRLLERRPRTRLLLLEKEPALARHQTRNNSGVIHSGLYYRPGSMKARTCRDGYAQLLTFCRDEGIAHEICGKIVVATEERELEPLEALQRRGVANGLAGLRWLSAAEITELEPHCRGVRGLLVPQTGIVDYAAVAERIGEKVRAAGGEIVLGERVDTLRRRGSRVEIVTSRTTRVAKLLVTCAGLQSDRLAVQTDPGLALRILPFRGEYYTLVPSARTLVRNLVYPVPDPELPFLGVHFTRTIGGEIECGPNAVLAFAREGYARAAFSARDTLDSLTWPGFRVVARRYWRTGLAEFHRSCRKAAFARALQRLVPEIREEHLAPGGSGVRAQACGRDGRLLDDFHVVESANVLHVCNAPSPAATASLAIGASIARSAAMQLA